MKFLKEHDYLKRKLNPFSNLDKIAEGLASCYL